MKMKYRAFKRVDGNWSITDQDNGQTLDLTIQSSELANKLCEVIHEEYYKGYEEGKKDNWKSYFIKGDEMKSLNERIKEVEQKLAAIESHNKENTDSLENIDFSNIQKKISDMANRKYTEGYEQALRDVLQCLKSE